MPEWNMLVSDGKKGGEQFSFPVKRAALKNDQTVSLQAIGGVHLYGKICITAVPIGEKKK